MIVISFFYPNTPTNTLAKTFTTNTRYISEGVFYTFHRVPISGGPNNVLGVSSTRQFPYVDKEIPYPVISAKSAIVADLKTKKILFNLNGDVKLAPASTTKLMTAVVSLDMYQLNQLLEVPSFCTTIEGQKAGFKEGEEISVENLIKTMLVTSAGDSACVLAASKLSYNDFVNAMNSKALDLEMKDTSFTNPIGLDGVNGTHYSTANDLLKLTVYTLKNELVRESVKTKELDFDGKKLMNTNKLLMEIPQTVGVKTGTTAEAGEVLIYEYKDEVKDLIIIVMGSKDRFEDTKALLNWTISSYVFGINK